VTLLRIVSWVKYNYCVAFYNFKIGSSLVNCILDTLDLKYHNSFGLE
jgi:hypothetical protein